MMRAVWDVVDQMCIKWAQQRRKMLGIVLEEKIEPYERLGKIRSTLGAVREEGEGAAYSQISQNWPEVYVGVALIVHRCWWGMPFDWKCVMQVHYVWRETPVRMRIKSLAISSQTYYERLGMLKVHLDGYVRCHDEVEKLSKQANAGQ